MSSASLIRTAALLGTGSVFHSPQLRHHITFIIFNLFHSASALTLRNEQKSCLIIRWPGLQSRRNLPDSVTNANLTLAQPEGCRRRELKQAVCMRVFPHYQEAEVLLFKKKPFLYFWNILHPSNPDSFPTDWLPACVRLPTTPTLASPSGQHWKTLW